MSGGTEQPIMCWCAVKKLLTHSLCRLLVAKNHNFGQILTFGGLLYRLLLPMMVKFGVLEQTQCLHLHATFHLNVFTVSVSGGHKSQFWAIFWHLGAPVPNPFYQWGPNLVCYSRPTLFTYTWNFVWIGLFCRPLAAKNPKLYHFFGLRHFVLLPLGSNLRKLNTAAQLQTFPYPTASKSFLYSSAFMAKWAHKHWCSTAWWTQSKLATRCYGWLFPPFPQWAISAFHF